MRPLGAPLLSPSSTPAQATEQQRQPTLDQIVVGFQKFRDLAYNYAILTARTERLDTMLSVQGRALTTAKTMVKDLLLLHRALTHKNKDAYALYKEQATAERYERYIDDYYTLKDRQSTTTTVRNEVRDAYLHV